MIPCQNDKHIAVLPPALLFGGVSAPCAIVDTLGFDYAKFVVILGDADIGLATLKIQESDNSGMSGATDIVGTRVGTDLNADGNASTSPVAITDDHHIFAFYLDLRTRKRYLQLDVTASSSASSAVGLAVLAELSLAQTIPSSAAGRGNTQDFIV